MGTKFKSLDEARKVFNELADKLKINNYEIYTPEEQGNFLKLLIL